MRFLQIGDLHIGKSVNGYSMKEDLKYALEQVYSYIDEYKPDGILLCGDIYDKSLPSTEAVRELDEVIDTLVGKGVEVYMISGNHDSAYRLAFAQNILSRQGVYMSGAYEGTVKCIHKEDEYGDLNIYLLPFVRPVQVREAIAAKGNHGDEISTYNDALNYVLSHIDTDKSARNIILSHQFISGSKKSDSEEITIGGLDEVNASAYDAFDYAALGHLHRPQQVTRPTIRYGGTLCAFSFSERDDGKSVVLIDCLADKEPTIELLPIKPRKRWVQIRATLDEMLAMDETDDYIQAVITDNGPVVDAVSRLKSGPFPNLMETVFEWVDHEIEHRFSEEDAKAILNLTPVELFESFYAEMTGEEPDQTVSDRIRAIYEEVRQG